MEEILITYGPFLEEWRTVKGFENHMISNYGRLKSIPRKVKLNKFGSYRNIKGSIINTHTRKIGYVSIQIRKPNGKKYNKLIHRLVAIAFILNPENKKQVNHLNGIKWDNFFLNLEWVTPLENSIHAWENNLTPVDGANHKLTKQQVIEIRSLPNTIKKADIAKMYNVKTITIYKVLNRGNWKNV